MRRKREKKERKKERERERETPTQTKGGRERELKSKIMHSFRLIQAPSMLRSLTPSSSQDLRRQGGETQESCAMNLETASPRAENLKPAFAERLCRDSASTAGALNLPPAMWPRLPPPARESNSRLLPCRVSELQTPTEGSSTVMCRRCLPLVHNEAQT